MACKNCSEKQFPLYQSTLKAPIEFSGYGVHSAMLATIRLLPAPSDTGVVFIRKDKNGKHIHLPALSQQTSATGLATILGHGAYRAEMVEHVMAAIAAFQLDNLWIELSDNEVPILDGGSFSYCQAFAETGLVFLEKKRRYIKIEKPIRVEIANGFAEFLPFDGCRFDVSIAFSADSIGESHYVFDLNAKDFHKNIAKARTFGFVKDIENLWAANMALGSSLDNSIVIGLDGKIVNPQGLYYPNEFVRHKMLDTIGDSALLGAPFFGLLRSYRGGHGLNAKLVNQTLADTSAFLHVFAT